MMMQNIHDRTVNEHCRVSCFVREEEYNYKERYVSCVYCKTGYIINYDAYQRLFRSGHIANFDTITRRINELYQTIEDEKDIRIHLLGMTISVGQANINKYTEQIKLLNEALEK